MTVTYANRVAHTTYFGYFKLFFFWRGSVYKVLLGEFALYVTLYYFLMLIYNFALPEDSSCRADCGPGTQNVTWSAKREFESIVGYFREYVSVVPLSFLLGFYVSVVFTRWWGIFMSLPWVHRCAVFASTYIHGKGERPTMIRRTLMRYLNLQAVLTLRSISRPVRKRFPTLHHMVGAGIMTHDEMRKIEAMDSSYGNYFVPTLWFGSLLNKAWDEGLIRDELHYRQLMDEANSYRGSLCAMLLAYDWVNIPLVYTQVVTLATYAYFLSTLFGRQYLPSEDQKHQYSVYFPIFTFIEFIFYVGWLKVGEVMINPLGGDDDDFEVNSVIDVNTVQGQCVWRKVQELGLAEKYKNNFISLPVSKEEARWADDKEDNDRESVLNANDSAVKIDKKDGSDMVMNTVPMLNVTAVETGRRTPYILKRVNVDTDKQEEDNTALINEADGDGGRR